MQTAYTYTLKTFLNSNQDKHYITRKYHIIIMKSFLYTSNVTEFYEDNIMFRYRCLLDTDLEPKQEYKLMNVMYVRCDLNHVPRVKISDNLGHLTFGYIILTNRFMVFNIMVTCTSPRI